PGAGRRRSEPRHTSRLLDAGVKPARTRVGLLGLRPCRGACRLTCLLPRALDRAMTDQLWRAHGLTAPAPRSATIWQWSTGDIPPCRFAPAGLPRRPAPPVAGGL